MNMRHLNIMIKPASGNCNMRCRYCFYHDLTEQRGKASGSMMNADTLEAVIRKALDSVTESCAFVFQGGEPTLAGMAFFQMVVKLQNKYNVNHVNVSNAIQTNGLLLDAEWADFFYKNHFLVGLSVDGSQAIHDNLRPDAQGEGTYRRVYQSAQLLGKYHVDFNILTVVTRQASRHAYKMYQQYKKMDGGICSLFLVWIHMDRNGAIHSIH
ncbi:MAG: radical SAM protein [Lachnospiraceae bacterium]|nr:radical SAM protein [Lachnospiraceae bacterium]